MTFFETLLGLMLAAILLLQVSRRLFVPYPAMLAAAGVGVALIPGVPVIAIDPAVALAVFIAPVVVDAAFDFPIGAARRFWLPLFTLAVVTVVVTAIVVAWLGTALAALPLAAAVALGAIVAPPDAAAATAILRAFAVPRTTDAVIKGESLFNDATALLLFSAAVSIQSRGALTWDVALHLVIAVPGGILLGIVAAFVVRKLSDFVGDSLGANLLQFVNSVIIWSLAARLQLSAILCVVTMAMALARNAGLDQSARMRVQTFAVWRSVVFALNVFAFLVMGMQSRGIVLHLRQERLHADFVFAGIIVVAVIATRFVVVLVFNRGMAWWRVSHGEPELASVSQALFAGWSGMRGLVTLATAFALPQDFPQRDLCVLTAFSVVIVTLVVQGFTLAPTIKLLKLDRRDLFARETAEYRAKLTAVGLSSLDTKSGPEADNVRYTYEIRRAALVEPVDSRPFDRHRSLGLLAIRAEREKLEAMRADYAVDADSFVALQEELDWHELTLLSDEDRQILEN